MLFELALVLAVACLAAVWGADGWRRQADAAAGNASGAWLAEIRGALARMMALHQEDLVQGLPPRDARGGLAYADPHAPRLDELLRQGHLPAGFPVASAGGMRVAIRILRHPACPGRGCRLDALVYSLAPAGAWGVGAETDNLTAGGAGGPGTDSTLTGKVSPDPAAIAAILAATGGYGGHVDAQMPDFVRGPNFRFPNPPAPDIPRLAVGTVAVWAGLDPAATWPYLRVRDPRNPDFQGDVAAAGSIHTAGSMHAAGSVHVRGPIHAAGSVHAGGAIDAAGAIHTDDSIHAAGAIHAARSMHAVERLSTDGHLLIGARARVGDACAPDGLMARTEDGSPLSCVGGRWDSPGGFGGAYAVNSVYGCKTYALVPTANPRTGDCSCPPGYESLMFFRTSDYSISADGVSTSYICVR
ncbi:MULTISPECIES: hypothetical protein [unclassified Achromobacter]|uniref:hypothetical protein n=1 Tax=unclassified Achromobacter TaxID=2626865 RepID=UPI000B51ACC2|nr:MULTISPECIES: hypothetical protein [unclassified Achromobacter]OWT77265.1 hypothetical protein CEY04_14990 [Achromobacter sp. HZ28]OWT78146.1 hypothetical protein CEY05_09485 [Achromobacter sp. HZ34]